MILNYLLLPVFFFIGLVTSYEDIRYGKIRNKWIILGFAWTLSAYFFFFIWSLFHFDGFGGEISLSLLLKSLLNGFAALCAAYLIWHFEGWSAGDAKLFFVFSLLIPITYYQKSYLPIFPSFALLVNIFIPLLLFLFFKSYFYLFAGLRIKGFGLLKRFFANIKKEYWLTRIALMSGFLGLFLFINFLKEQTHQNFLTEYSAFFGAAIIAGLAIFSFSGSAAAFFKKPIVIKIALAIFAFSLAYGFIFMPYSAWRIFIRSALLMIIFALVLGFSRKLLRAYIKKEEEKERESFPMAIWIFLGGMLTLILKESVLSLIFNIFS